MLIAVIKNMNLNKKQNRSSLQIT